MISIGTVTGAHGGLAHALLPGAAIGQGVRLRNAEREITGTVTAVQLGRAMIALHADIQGIAAGDSIVTDPAACCFPLGTALLGRAVDADGTAIDGGPAIDARPRRARIFAPGVNERVAVTKPFWTGVRVIDGLFTIGRGARIGIFGAPGAGKSTLLQMMCTAQAADAVVVGLIGERGREAEEWLRAIGPHLTVVCATSDRPAAVRVRAARFAMAQADALRARGLDVLLIVDSLARYANALREIAVAANESVGRGGYPPSVFSDLASFVEGAGASRAGSVTLVATVLSDGDDRDPVSDAARSLLDGHLELTAPLARKGRYPAIDVCAGTSRTMSAVVSARHLDDAAVVKAAVSSLQASEDARALGLMPSSARALRAVAAEDAIESFLCQGKQPTDRAATLSALAALADRLR
ncbi:MAG TPA: ATP-binding cassette domain-containing protein [Candidatus Baltobacteraceae bacterium]|jgi:type III secretion protein N (ATPase)|nr:ATP-binding cassette domain-containing protein [Candidatus Baltobacteraceae bacterium]